MSGWVDELLHDHPVVAEAGPGLLAAQPEAARVFLTQKPPCSNSVSHVYINIHFYFLLFFFKHLLIFSLFFTFMAFNFYCYNFFYVGTSNKMFSTIMATSHLETSVLFCTLWIHYSNFLWILTMTSLVLLIYIYIYFNN